MVDTDFSTEEFSQDQWQLVLFSLLYDLPVKEWNEFVHDLIYKNRFSSSHKVVDIIKAYAGKCEKVIKKGRILYRARIYHEDPLQEFLSGLFFDVKSNANKLGNIPDNYNIALAALMMTADKDTAKSKEIIDAYKSWQDKKFKGYDLSNSGAPPAFNATSGRLNPAKISYLYLAEDPETAIYEVRPTIGQYVSVATFETQEEIKIYDLAVELENQEVENWNFDYALFCVIQQRFSEPNAGDVFKYLPTQYLGEVIKQMGFDGLRFKSSLKNGGVNMVLFDEKKCMACQSDIIKVGDIELKISNPEIYELERLLDINKHKGY